MDAKRKDLLERIAKGEEKLAALSASDPKRDAIEKNLAKLRQQLDALGGAKSQTSVNSTIEESKPWTYEPPFIEVDPRPDLKDDSVQWSTLLKMAFMRNEELCGVLNGMRCCGTRIKAGRTSAGTYRWMLKPDLDPTGRDAWGRLEDYEAARDKYLIPHMSEVTELLADLAERHNPREG